MNSIRVECYSGYRADERPVRFHLRGRSYAVAEVQDRWYSPDALYFRVIAQDGNWYVLKHALHDDEQRAPWTLEAFRAARPGEPK